MNEKERGINHINQATEKSIKLAKAMIDLFNHIYRETEDETVLDRAIIGYEIIGKEIKDAVVSGSEERLNEIFEQFERMRKESLEELEELHETSRILEAFDDVSVVDVKVRLGDTAKELIDKLKEIEEEFRYEN